MKVNTAYIKFIIALLIYGANGIWIEQISLPTYQMVFLRTVLAVAVLLSIFLIARKKFTFHKKPKDFFFLALSGLFLGGAWLSLFVAYKEGGIPFGTLAYYCGPVIVMALSPFVFKEKLTPTRVIGFVIAMTGVVLFNGQAFLTGVAPFGVFCGAVSACCAACMIMFNKKAGRIDGLENPLLQMVFAFVASGLFILITGNFEIHMQQSDILPMLILGVVNTGFTGYLYFSSIIKLPAQTVATVGYLEPLSAVLFSAIFLDQHLTVLGIIGGICILAGAFFAESMAFRRSRKESGVQAEIAAENIKKSLSGGKKSLDGKNR
ncbi:MAG TPA: DMT family transporter [Methanocorpusculum sp.]|nr:DMT family transporter [Methanocorpusculum sp.]